MDDQEIPGNVGLLDVRKALSWIQKNIIAFGGDPQRVTLAGQDSGATLAMILKSVDIGDNLFSKLILHSGQRVVRAFTQNQLTRTHRTKAILKYEIIQLIWEI